MSDAPEAEGRPYGTRSILERTGTEGSEALAGDGMGPLRATSAGAPAYG